MHVGVMQRERIFASLRETGTYPGIDEGDNVFLVLVKPNGIITLRFSRALIPHRLFARITIVTESNDRKSINIVSRLLFKR